MNGRSRKPLPPFGKGLCIVVKVLDLTLENEVSPESVTALGPDQTRR
ncbi:MAG: hypothetical protein GY856_50165 [bacterium]|nr:hypothetical protein [bacterium]